MATLTISAISNFYKTLQPEGMESLVLPVSPFLGQIKKWTEFYGTVKQLAWLINRGSGVSYDFATAQANAGTPSYLRPNITRSRLYCVRQIDNEALEASQSNAGALRDLLVEQRDLAMQELKYRASSVILGNGSGAVGQISSGSNVGTATITLADITQIRNIAIGMVLNTFTAGDAAVNAGDCTVTGVNEETGTVTLAGNWNATSTGVAAGDYLVPKGDYLTVPKGVFGWCPTTLPTVGGGDSWFGVDRGGSIAMAGCRYAPTSGTAGEVLINALHLHDRLGGKHDAIFANPMDLGNLTKEFTNLQRINTNAIGSGGKQIASVSYQAVVLNGPQGPVNVFSEPNVPRYQPLITRVSAWELWSLHEAFRLLDRGMTGGQLPIYNADGIELRFGGYWNLVTKVPRDSMVVTLPTA